MPFAVSPNQSQIQTVLVSFLSTILNGIPVVRGQINRVGEPKTGDFVVFWPLRRIRLATNIDTYADAVFVGSISGTVMTITEATHGSLSVGTTIFGVDVAADTVIISFGTGTGGVGTYNVSVSQTVGSIVLAGGVEDYMQETEIDFQLDVHGPSSSDNAQIISTMFRDAYAVDFFYNLNPAVSPLHADDPKQIPFLNDQNQYEDRYVVEARVQANQAVTLPQQFAAEIVVGIINVDATYPPS